MRMEKGVLLIVSGPSGCGKGTVLKYVLEDSGYSYSVSATTRPPREGDVDGKDYFFLSKEAFEEAVKQGKMLEYTVYCDNYYGTPKDFVQSRLAEGVNVVLEIETEGAENVKKAMPDALSVFLAPPDMDALEARLRGRGTEDNATVEKRLAKAKKEMLLAPTYDILIVNQDGLAEDAARQIMEAVAAKRKAQSQTIN